jgi:hypothetical protein
MPVCWANDPPIINPSDPRSNAWAQYQYIPVTVFDVADNQPTSQPDFDAIDSGIRDWNTVRISGCSIVTHGEATRANRAWLGPTEVPPSGALYVVRTTDRSGQLVTVTNSTNVTRAWLYMRSDYTYQTSDPHTRLHNLAKHEAGHGFGLGNGALGAPPSVMGQNSFVTKFMK